MTKPFRLRVLEALTDTLKQISKQNGFSVDLEGRVYRGRLLFGPNDKLPFISILETPMPPEQVISPAPSTASTGNWDLLIQGFAQDDEQNPTDPAHYLMADVKKVLAAERKRRRGVHGEDVDILGMAGKVSRLEIGPGVVRPADEMSDVANFWLAVTLKIVEDNNNPFA